MLNTGDGRGGRRAGRRPATNPRSRHLRVRLTAAEQDRFNDLVRRSGLRLADYVRHQVLRDQLPRPVPQPNKEAWADLARLASNINQAVKLLNSGQPAPFRLEDLLELNRSVATLRDALLGRS